MVASNGKEQLSSQKSPTVFTRFPDHKFTRKFVFTAGADAHLVVHNLGNPDEPPLAASVLHKKAVMALYMAPNGVKFEGNITRFTLPVCCLAFSITDGLLAAAGDDDKIKLVSTVDNSTVRVLKGHQAPVLSLAFDPKNDKLASMDSHGTVTFWDLGSGAKINCLSHVAPDVSVDEAGTNKIAWNPSRDVLAIPGHKSDVVMYDRETAEVQCQLTNCHSTTIGCLAWSPNGKYLATTGQDRKVMLWDTKSELDLDRLKVISQVIGLSQKPTGNALALIDVDGKFDVWEDAIPAHLPSPSDLPEKLASLSRQELLHFTDDDVSFREDLGSGDEDLKYGGEEEPLKESDDDDGKEREDDSLEVEDVRKSKESSTKESKLLILSPDCLGDD